MHRLGEDVRGADHHLVAIGAEPDPERDERLDVAAGAECGEGEAHIRRVFGRNGGRLDGWCLDGAGAGSGLPAGASGLRILADRNGSDSVAEKAYGCALAGAPHEARDGDSALRSTLASVGATRGSRGAAQGTAALVDRRESPSFIECSSR
jgi:hypothetical protein